MTRTEGSRTGHSDAGDRHDLRYSRHRVSSGIAQLPREVDPGFVTAAAAPGRPDARRDQVISDRKARPDEPEIPAEGVSGTPAVSHVGKV